METKINLDDVMEIKVNLNNLTEEELKKFCELLEKAKTPVSKVWKPKKDEYYWLINDCGLLTYYVWNGERFCHNLFAIGNCFKNKEEAKNAVERLKIRAELQRYADEHNDKIDWKDGKQDKWYIYFDYINGRLDYNRLLCNRDSFQIYFTSYEIVQAAVKAVGEERIKKYLFGVEE